MKKRLLIVLLFLMMMVPPKTTRACCGLLIATGGLVAAIYCNSKDTSISKKFLLLQRCTQKLRLLEAREEFESLSEKEKSRKKILIRQIRGIMDQHILISTDYDDLQELLKERQKPYKLGRFAGYCAMGIGTLIALVECCGGCVPCCCATCCATLPCCAAAAAAIPCCAACATLPCFVE